MATIAEALHAAASHYQSGNASEAQRLCREILSVEPRNAKAHYYLGLALRSLGQSDEAVACYRQALAIQGDYADAHFSLGVALQHQGDWAAAADSYRDAIRARPDFFEAYNNLGTLHRLQNQLEQAVECYSRALEFRPDFAEALNNLGNVFKAQGRFTEAWVCYDQAQRMQPENAKAHYNRGLMLLSVGRMAEGWPEYEWRWNCSDFPQRAFTQPRWNGEPLEGRVLLVHAEQGLGDVLQFIRYVPLLARCGGRVVVEIPAALHPLLHESGIQDLIARGAALPAFDLHAPLLSLPGILGRHLEDIPDRVPYLTARPSLIENWRGVVRGTPGLKVGIAWQGSATYGGDRFRSIPLTQFKPLAQASVELISLQKGPGSEQLAAIAGSFSVRDFGDDLDTAHGPFMDTAAIIGNLDLVVTSDTAVAHLAGALAVPTWVALPLAADWRWMRDRDDTPWYPHMRLFRQSHFDDWPPVFHRMAEELQAAAASRPASHS